MAAAKKEAVNDILIHPLKIQVTRIRLVGDTPLIVHAWSYKAKQMMLEAQTGKAKGKKKPVRRPADDFVQAAYWLTPKPVYSDEATDDEIMDAFNAAIENGARFGFPVTAFKQAATAAAYRLGWIKNQMGARGAFYFKADEEGLVEIKSDPPVMREDMVKIGMGTADLRYRPQFNNWSVVLDMVYNAEGDFSFENLINMIAAGGFVCGAGEWRVEKDGVYGQYHVETA